MCMNRLPKSSLCLLLYFTSQLSFALQIFSVETVQLKNTNYQLEIADTYKRKKQGLMYRKSLAKDEGMLFVYSKAGDHRIWMKNTLIPLTVIWLDEYATIIEIKILQPCKSSNCPASVAPVASKYILELHPSQQDRFKIGDSLPGIFR